MLSVNVSAAVVRIDLDTQIGCRYTQIHLVADTQIQIRDSDTDTGTIRWQPVIIADYKWPRSCRWDICMKTTPISDCIYL